MDQSTLKRREKYYAIKTTHIPFLEYLSYMYYCGSTLCGPNFEYKDFVNFIELKENYSKIPPTISATTIRMAHGFACLALHLILSEFTNIEYIISPEFAG
jgi:hypothetical protein